MIWHYYHARETKGSFFDSSARMEKKDLDMGRELGSKRWGKE